MLLMRVSITNRKKNRVDEFIHADCEHIRALYLIATFAFLIVEMLVSLLNMKLHVLNQ